MKSERFNNEIQSVIKSSNEGLRWSGSRSLTAVSAQFLDLPAQSCPLPNHEGVYVQLIVLAQSKRRAYT